MAANEAGGAGPPPAGGVGLPVPDLQTMEELCQPSLDGRGGPIAPIAIQATTFGLKNDMIQQAPRSVYDLIEIYDPPSNVWILTLIKDESSVLSLLLILEK
ncbi:hypothetical protein Tco_0767337 [Tanacetum coccineum]